MQINRYSAFKVAILKNAIYIYLFNAFLALSIISCTPNPPTIVEVNLPEGSTDQLGPYAVSAKYSGLVDKGRLYWVRSNLEQLGQDDGVVILDNQNDTLTGELPGGMARAAFSVWFEVSGGGGVTRYPQEGVYRFEVNAISSDCTADQQCLDGEICHRIEGYCFLQPEQCINDLDCPRDMFCNGETEQCRFYDSACLADEDCATGSTCEAGRCINPCDRCQSTERCEGGVCVQRECTVDGDCDASQQCSEGRCIADPVDDCGGCMSGFICEMGECIATGCMPACDENQVCQDGECTPRTRCEDGCPEGLFCDGDICVECTADGQCPMGEMCDLKALTCVTGERKAICDPCLGDSCGPNLTCHPNELLCVPSCRTDTDCITYSELAFCEDGMCIESGICGGYYCYQDEDCSTDQYCESGLCTRSQRCVNSIDCRDDHACINGRCVSSVSCNFSDQFTCSEDAVCLANQCQVTNPNQPTSMTCMPCERHDECGENEVCTFSYDRQAKYCFTLCDSQTTCELNTQCYFFSEGIGVCDSEEGLCSSEYVCTPDAYEYNDDIESATPLILDEEEPLLIESSVCPEDMDWYELQQTRDVLLNVYCGIDVIVEAYDEFGEYVANALVTGNIAQNIEMIGVKYIWMLPAAFDPDLPSNCLLSLLSLESSITCDDDALEPNDSAADAWPIGSGADLSLTLCPGDQDVFSLRAAGAGDLVRVNVDWSGFPSGSPEVIYTSENFEVGYVINTDEPTDYDFDSTGPGVLSIKCLDCIIPERYQMGVLINP